MTKSKKALKEEVIRYFQEHSIGYLTIISDEIKKILESYEDEEKIEAINKLINSYEADTNGIRTAFKDFDDLCAKESAVFVEAYDYSASQTVEAIKKRAMNFELMLKDLIGKTPEDKNEKILCQAQKIKLFDYICEKKLLDNSYPEYCYFADMKTEDGQVLLLKPIFELHNYLQNIKRESSRLQTWDDSTR